MKIHNLLASTVLAAVIAPAVQSHTNSRDPTSLTVAQTGNVTVTFVGSDAAYADLLFCRSCYVSTHFCSTII